MLAKRNKVDGSTPLDCLKAWVHWATVNPVSEDQKEMAMAINDLFAQVGNWKAKAEKQCKACKELKVIGTTGCDGCEDGRVTMYSQGTHCLECKHAAQSSAAEQIGAETRAALDKARAELPQMFVPKDTPGNLSPQHSPGMRSGEASASPVSNFQRADECVDYWYDRIDSSLTHPEQVSLVKAVAKLLDEVTRPEGDKRG